MYAPGVRWTAARHKIPLLAVMHNNRGYHQEVMHVQRMSNFRNRVVNTGKDMGPVGTGIHNPDIDYRKLAESMGWWAKGPIKNPSELGPALKEAVAMAHVREARLLAVPWLRRPGQRRRFEAFSDFVRTTGGAMPPYQKAILSDEDLADIYAYLQSVPKARDPKTIPLLNP